MRHRGGEPYADCGVHHLPETQQRRGRAGFLPEWGERPRGSQWTDNAHAEEKYAHRGQKRQEGRADRRDEHDRNAAGGRRPQSRPDRTIEPVAWRQFRRQHTRGEYDENGACKEEAELDRREVQRFNE